MHPDTRKILAVGSVLETVHGRITIRSAENLGDRTIVHGVNQQGREQTVSITNIMPNYDYEMHIWLEDELGWKPDRCYYATLCGRTKEPVQRVMVNYDLSGIDLKRITCESCILLLFAKNAELHDEEQEDSSDPLGTGS